MANAFFKSLAKICQDVQFSNAWALIWLSSINATKVADITSFTTERSSYFYNAALAINRRENAYHHPPSPIVSQVTKTDSREMPRN